MLLAALTNEGVVVEWKMVWSFYSACPGEEMERLGLEIERKEGGRTALFTSAHFM